MLRFFELIKLYISPAWESTRKTMPTTLSNI